MEFAVAYVFKSEVDRLPLDGDDYAETHAKVLVFNDDKDPWLLADARVFGHVQRTLDKLSMYMADSTKVVPDGYSYHSSWKCKEDCSIDLPDGHGIMGRYKGCRWLGVEVTSPALWNDPRSFEEVRMVCDALQKKYFMVTAPSCGLHFHIGRGLPGNYGLAAPSSLRDLRRIAALLFAADHILVQLHPVHRYNNQYCLGNRWFSEVAQQVTHQQARLVVDEIDIGCPPPVEPQPELVEQVTMFNSSTSGGGPPRFFTNRLIPYGTLQDYPVLGPGEAPKFPVTMLGEPCNLLAPRSILDCVGELLSASRTCVVAELMKSGLSERLAYNFNNIQEGLVWGLEGQTTIEFRQGAGTLDADEVIAFAKLWLGLCERASDGPFSQTWAVINRCHVAEMRRRNGADVNFDAFDLLAMLGLSDEAETLQSVIMARLARAADSGPASTGPMR